MRVVVLSLGGSIIIPENINFDFLEKFKKEIRKHYKNTKFVLVCGGGSIARKYIEALKREGKDEMELANAGIRSTRMNAMFMMQFFGKEANDKLPKNMQEVKNNLHKNNVVICGALRYADNETSDGTAAKLASLFNSDFINMTNIKGLYSADPRKDKNAKFISKITWQDFEVMANKTKFSAGQHFVLDQEASIIIRKNKINTYIVNEDTVNLGKLLNNKKFVGTLISG